MKKIMDVVGALLVLYVVVPVLFALLVIALVGTR